MGTTHCIYTVSKLRHCTPYLNYMIALTLWKLPRCFYAVSTLWLRCPLYCYLHCICAVIYTAIYTVIYTVIYAVIYTAVYAVSVLGLRCIFDMIYAVIYTAVYAVYHSANTPSTCRYSRLESVNSARCQQASQKLKIVDSFS
jgi:hypothetical protein